MHLLTRGNVDGITSAALVLARWPDARVHFVTNATVASQWIRRDLSSDRFILIDLGLTPDLAKTLARKSAAGVAIAVLDHHQQTRDHAHLLPAAIEARIEAGKSAAAVTRAWLGIEDLAHLAAIADVVEYCASDDLATVRAIVGASRLAEEARCLDFAWRQAVSDDEFRLAVARRLSQGDWPMQVPEARARYLQMCNERRWERALERVRARVRVQGKVAVLAFGKRKPSLFGFGARALTEVAREKGCTVAVLVHRRDRIASVSLRVLTHEMHDLGTSRPRPSTELNLGRFLERFTQQHGIVGGGHPESAGGKIPARHVSTFVEEIACFA